MIPVWVKLWDLPKEPRGDDDRISFATNLVTPLQWKQTKLLGEEWIMTEFVFSFLLPKNRRRSSLYMLGGTLNLKLNMNGYRKRAQNATFLGKKQRLSMS